MTTFGGHRYDRIEAGGYSLTEDFEKLARLVRGLVSEHRELRRENDGLRRDLAERDARIAALDGELADAGALRAVIAERDAQIAALEESLRNLNQLRLDVAKRIDDLIHQVETLDARLGAADA